MSGTDLALRITFAVVALICLITGIYFDSKDNLGCFSLIALILVGGSCMIGAFAGPEAAYQWLNS